MLNVKYKNNIIQITRMKVSGPCSTHSVAYFCVPRLDFPLDLNEKKILVLIIFFLLSTVRLPYTGRLHMKYILLLDKHYKCTHTQIYNQTQSYFHLKLFTLFCLILDNICDRLKYRGR